MILCFYASGLCLLISVMSFLIMQFNTKWSDNADKAYKQYAVSVILMLLSFAGFIGFGIVGALWAIVAKVM